jgi:uncharacterized protein with GYD domain
MQTFFMFGKYSSESLKGIGPKRTDKTLKLFKELGGEVKSIYALLGNKDLVLIADLPNTEQVMKASVALHKLTGISFSTVPAVTVEEFDRMMAEQ